MAAVRGAYSVALAWDCHSESFVRFLFVISITINCETLFGMTLAELGVDLPRRCPNAGQRLDIAAVRTRTPSLLISRRADMS